MFVYILFLPCVVGGDHWLGLETVHRMTYLPYVSYALWIKIVDTNNIPHIYPYSHFSVLDEDSHYRLSVKGYQGKLQDYFIELNGKPFVTKDHYPQSDNDNPNPSDCATSQSASGGGGWWFSRYQEPWTPRRYEPRPTVDNPLCGSTNLNARNVYFSDSFTSIRSVEMKIRPVE